jgi:hypothetical protein
MFESLKSAESLERDLREWYFQDQMMPYMIGRKPVPSDEVRRMKEFAQRQDAQTLIQFGISSIMLTNNDAEISRATVGRANDVELRHINRGFKIIQALAKKRGWRVTWRGALPSESDVMVEII